MLSADLSLDSPLNPKNFLAKDLFIGPRERSERGPTKPLQLSTGAFKSAKKTTTFERRAKRALKSAPLSLKRSERSSPF